MLWWGSSRVQWNLYAGGIKPESNHSTQLVTTVWPGWTEKSSQIFGLLVQNTENSLIMKIMMLTTFLLPVLCQDGMFYQVVINSSTRFHSKCQQQGGMLTWIARDVTDMLHRCWITSENRLWLVLISLLISVSTQQESSFQFMYCCSAYSWLSALAGYKLFV